MTTPLQRWLDTHGGASAKRALVCRAMEREGRRIRWQTLHLIARGTSTPTPETAVLLERITDGEVSAAELLGLTSRNVSTSSADASEVETFSDTSSHLVGE